MKVISIDIGATSGRVMVVEHNNGRLAYEEIHRFKNRTYLNGLFLHWDFKLLLGNIIEGIKKALALHNDIESIGIDTFGVDYGILDKNGKLIDDPLCYRDTHSYEKQAEVLKLIPFDELYSQIGIQNLHFNTIYQLYDDARLKEADTILLFPDLIAYFLTGEKRMELTNASTTSLYNYEKKEIDKEILKKLSIPASIFPKMIYPKDKYGDLKKGFYPEGYKGNKVEVIATCSHDTASSVLGMNGFGKFAYLSSGTWSLLGTELDKPLLSEESKDANFTNEIGIDFSVRYLKNTMGMFLINEVVSDLKEKKKGIKLPQIVEMAKEAKDIGSYLDTNDPRFETPGDMLNKVKGYLIETKQKLPETPGELFRLIYKSMAFSYKRILDKLEELIGYKTDYLLISGGGNQAEILNQFTANAINKEVKTGPIESTVFGNSIAQFIHYGDLKDVSEARKTIDNSIKSRTYTPKDVEEFEKEYQDYLRIISKEK